jgi:hypothetical protein
MNMKCKLRLCPGQPAGDNAPDSTGRRPVMLICITLMFVALAAPLLLTLPRTLDAAQSPAPAMTMPTPASVSEPAFHERHAPQGTTSWSDSLEESALATWRLRYSD